MRLFRHLVTFLLFVYLVAPLSILAVDKKVIIAQARRSYYNLANSGLTEFRCEVLPDWDSTFSGVKADPLFTDKVLPILRETRFKLVVGPTGASTVSHESELAPPNEEVAERLRQAITGTEQVVSGFVETWSQFVVNSTPLPDENDDFQFEDIGDKYRINVKHGTDDGVIFRRQVSYQCKARH